MSLPVHPHALTAKTPRKHSVRPPPSELKSPAQGNPAPEPLDVLQAVVSVVKNRSGSVLSRQTILKSDHFDTGFNPRLDFHLQGAPNFRCVELNIFGVAQPTISGIRTVATLLGCAPTSASTKEVLWFSSREEPIIYLNRKPFVIRDSEHPLTNVRFVQGISASRLENMETRLKEDIQREAGKFGGLLLVHDELENGRVIPTWMAIDHIQTSREVFESLISEGFRIKYFRIPVSPEQTPEDRYVDEYVEIIKQAQDDDALVFNCGMGVGRTTFATILATLLRRAQLISKGQEDPIRVASLGGSQYNLLNLEEAESQSRALLRLMYVLEKGLAGKQPGLSALDWVLARGPLVTDLKNAILGNYQCISQLASVISNGGIYKKVLDEVIDRCDVMVNLREVTLIHRVDYFFDGNPVSLRRALGCLERYFFLLAFCSYVDKYSTTGYQHSFSEWLKLRPEILVMLENFRNPGPQLHLFRPVEDLSLLSTGPDSRGAMMRDNARPTAFELERQVVNSRRGTVLGPHTILKVDHWQQEMQDTIEGAANFRKVPGLNVYSVAQPTIQGVKNVLSVLEDDSPSITKVVWINLREEPLIYINGVPYVLRDQYVTLRNIKSYSGITAGRLELMETRLKSDTMAELSSYENQLLLHNETSDGSVVPQWEDCLPTDVLTLKEVFDLVRQEEQIDGTHSEIRRPSSMDGTTPRFLNRRGSSPRERARTVNIAYHRVPVTAESPPGAVDFDDLRRLICSVDPENTAIVMNCQIGMGRSTTGTVVTCLVLHWLRNIKPTVPKQVNPPLNYAIIHSLMRVIRNGLECKKTVDDFIDACGAHYNLREAIEEARLRAETSTEENGTRNTALSKGMLNLRRYFLLLAFASYLDQNKPGLDSELTSFATWVDRHAEFAGMKDAMMDCQNGMEAILPVERMDPGDGLALSSEVLQVVKLRSGAVLGKNTILKYDMFPGAQKLSLTERVDGAPNYRRIPLATVRALPSESASAVSSIIASDSTIDRSSQASAVYGIGMPTISAVKDVLRKVQADPEGSRQLVWTSLREEPVLYINSRPYVLRLFQDPMKNLEATGITHERVEAMEYQMKMDAIAEVKQYGGRMLLHEEEADAKGFSIVPVWETVKEEDIQTPKEVYGSIQIQGYHVDYMRLPITDEQAPIPDVFDRLVERLTAVSEGTDIMFNCQMGRGRTTTGMVITCLMEMVIGNQPLLSEYEKSIDQDENEVSGHLSAVRPIIFPSSPATPMGLVHSTSKSNLALRASSSAGTPIALTTTLTPLPDEATIARQRYTSGEYKLILQLVAVLQHGKLAKRLADRAIDACEHIQNLRVAVYDSKLRVEALRIGDPKREKMMEIAINYLVRYFYLIVFAGYLLEVWAGEVPELGLPTMKETAKSVTQTVQEMEEKGFSAITGAGRTKTPAGKPLAKLIPFSAWLGERREIANLAKRELQTLE
ncbi:inositol hexakisphosphate-domain-containing protein [Phlyctochytrium arcticum]|nr:inositol hexakisphosphate-domain-containing protein [Phlyctochytrium arcticum]